MAETEGFELLLRNRLERTRQDQKDPSRSDIYCLLDQCKSPPRKSLAGGWHKLYGLANSFKKSA